MHALSRAVHLAPAHRRRRCTWPWWASIAASVLLHGGVAAAGLWYFVLSQPPRVFIQRSSGGSGMAGPISPYHDSAEPAELVVELPAAVMPKGVKMPNLRAIVFSSTTALPAAAHSWPAPSGLVLSRPAQQGRLPDLDRSSPMIGLPASGVAVMPRFASRDFPKVSSRSQRVELKAGEKPAIAGNRGGEKAGTLPVSGAAEGGGAGGDPIPVAGNPSPRYPPEALRKRLEGTVLLGFIVTADGSVTNLSVARSSGHRILDKAAIDAVRRWHFQPALRAGVPVPHHAKQPIYFIFHAR